MNLDFSRCRLAPFQHQREDTAWLLETPHAFIASEMRTGKTKIVIDAAQFMFEMGMIDKVIVVAPASVRDVWYDPTLGELAKHLWKDVPANVWEYHSRSRNWHQNINGGPRLEWYVTNYEFIRAKSRLMKLMVAAGRKTLLVLDESSFIKSHKAAQTKSCAVLRNRCGRVVLLNGTPIFHSPQDLFSQGNMIHEDILGTPYITHFMARYAIQTAVLGHGGKPMQKPYGGTIMKVSGWTNLEDLERRFAPYTRRRLQKECLDLPPKLDPVPIFAQLEESWPAYKQMRDGLVVWLNENVVASSSTIAIKGLRLAQITGGFLGGVEDARIDPDVPISGIVTTQEIGREKLEALLQFIEDKLEGDKNFKLISWSRFRAEAERAAAEVKKRFPQFETAVIMGGQQKEERLRALGLLNVMTAPEGPVFIAGVEGTGSFGLDMCAAHTCVTMSSGYSPGRALQTLDRVYGPNQTHPIGYFDIVATGPKGQRTIDHDILLARRAGEDVAMRTAAAWVKTLLEE